MHGLSRVILFGCLILSVAKAATLQVPEDYPTIQAAVDSAAAGDTVLVATGAFTGAGNLDITTGGKRLVIRSEHGPDSTTIVFRSYIEGEFFTRCFLFDSTADGSSVLEGFTVIDSSDYQSIEGRAIFITGTSPTIRRCVIRGFRAGSPVVVGGGSPSFDHCLFVENTGGCSACKEGGADKLVLWLGRASAVRCTNGGNAVFENCDFIGNIADVAQGALLCDASSPLLVDCRFESNTGYYSHGAAVVVGNGASPIFAKCSFEDNRNDAINRDRFGGAIYLRDATASFDACLFDSNVVFGGGREYGTGIGADSGSAVSLTGCTFTRNEGEGVTGVSAVWCGPAATVTAARSLFAFNRSRPPVGRADSTGSLSLTCSDIFGNDDGDWTGDIAGQLGVDSNFSADPYLCEALNPIAGLFEISPCAPANSPCGSLVGAFGVGCLNNRPAITSPYSALAYEDSLFVYVPTFEDPDGPDTVVSYTGIPSWCAVSNDSLTGTPVEGTADTSFVLIVSDGFKADTQAVYVNTIPVNDPPVLDSIADAEADEGQLLEFVVTASDQDSEAIVLTAEGLPEGALVVDSGNGAGLFRWTPGYQQAGTYELLVVATDDSLAADSQTVAITVNPVNAAPVIEPVDSQFVFEGLPWELLLGAADPDGDSVVLTVGGLPLNAAFVDSGNGRGVLTFQPDSTQNGVYGLVITAADSALADSLALTVVVLDSVPAVAGLSIATEADLQHVVGNAPLFVWEYADPFQTRFQTQFEIAVGVDSEWTAAELWADTLFTSPETSVAYGGDSLVDGAVCFVRLRVENGVAWSGWYEMSFRLNTRPSAPVAIAPAEGGYALALPVLWVTNGTDAEADTLAYEFVVCRDSADFSVDSQYVMGVAEGVDSTGWQPTEPLVENHRYLWRARAFDGFEFSGWTDSLGASFWVNDSPEPPPMSTTTPLTDGCSLIELLPAFTWSRSLDPDPLDTISYQLHLATDWLFDSATVIGPLDDTTYTATDSLEFGREYWWKVTTADNTGQTVESAVQSFWTWMLADVSDDHTVAVSDLTLLIGNLFRGGTLLCGPETGDVTGDCAVNVSDLTYMIAYLFRGGAAPSAWCGE